MAGGTRPLPSLRLLNLLKDFQQMASMSGFANHSFDVPQLRLFFTLYARVMVDSPEQGAQITPRLQAWCDTLSVRLREDSSSAIMPPQIQISAPQTMPDGRFYVVATVTFVTKVTEASYLRVRTAVLQAYQAAVAMRDRGFEAAEEMLRAREHQAPAAVLAEEQASGLQETSAVETTEVVTTNPERP